MVPRRKQKSRNECINNQKNNQPVETKVLQLQIITQKKKKKAENVVESIINDYYWEKLIEKLIKSNIKN